MALLYLTDRTRDDLIEIEDYSIRRWGGDVAADYIARFVSAFDLLRESPGLLRDQEAYTGRLRFYRVRKHWLVCHLIAETIYVVTVMHGAVDLPARLAELEPRLIEEAEVMHRRLEGRSEQ